MYDQGGTSKQALFETGSFFQWEKPKLEPQRRFRPPHGEKKDPREEGNRVDGTKKIFRKLKRIRAKHRNRATTSQTKETFHAEPFSSWG